MLVRQTCTGSQIFFSEFQHISIYIPASLDIERHAFCHVKGSAFAYYLYRTYIRSQKKTITRFFFVFCFLYGLVFCFALMSCQSSEYKTSAFIFLVLFFFFLQSNRIALPRDVNALTSHTPAPRHHSKLTTKCISHWMEYLTDSRNRSHACYSTRFFFFHYFVFKYKYKSFNVEILSISGFFSNSRQL